MGARVLINGTWYKRHLCEQIAGRSRAIVFKLEVLTRVPVIHQRKAFVHLKAHT